MNSHTVPPSTVADDEVLARFILHKRYIRNDGTLKPDLFIPHPHTDLSVTRHVWLEESSIWAIGEGGCHTTVKDTVRTGRCFGAGQTSTKDVRPRNCRGCVVRVKAKRTKLARQLGEPFICGLPRSRLLWLSRFHRGKKRDRSDKRLSKKNHLQANAGGTRGVLA